VTHARISKISYPTFCTIESMNSTDSTPNKSGGDSDAIAQRPSSGAGHRTHPRTECMHLECIHWSAAAAYASCQRPFVMTVPMRDVVSAALFQSSRLRFAGERGRREVSTHEVADGTRLEVRDIGGEEVIVW
jgi:hypothetical protein